MISHAAIISEEDAGRIFNNMSDGVMIVDRNMRVVYYNQACRKLFFKKDDIRNADFREAFLSDPDNKEFNEFFNSAVEHHLNTKKTVSFHLPNREKIHVIAEISMKEDNDDDSYDFDGMLIMFEDVTEHYRLKTMVHDSSNIFFVLVSFIAVYLSIWCLTRFTLKAPLTNRHYTLMIEGITFLLFLEVLFATSFKFGDIGLIVNKFRWKRNVIETVTFGAIACALLLILRVLQIKLGLPGKSYFIGGSWKGCIKYLITCAFQEFLARGVIQTSVKYILQIPRQRGISIIITSFLFMMMHIPFGFPFMLGAFVLSLVLGLLYENQQDLYGCVLLHWGVGYLGMCLFF